MRTVTGAIEVGDGLTRQILQANSIADSPAAARKPPARVRPETISVEKISVARLPITGSEVFGREEDIAFLDDAWANRQVNVATIVPGVASESPRSSTIGSEEWLLNIIVPPNWFLAGHSTGKVPAGTLRLQMNFLTPLSLGLLIRTSE